MIHKILVFLAFLCLVCTAWFLPGCTIQQTRIGFGVSVAADYGSTDWALAHSSTEGNPIVSRAGLTTAAVSSLLTVLLAEYCIHKGKEDTARMVYILGSAIHFGAAGNNGYQIRKQSTK